MSLVTIVVPAYNEADNLPALYKRLASVAKAALGYRFEFLFVDDGSTDESAMVLYRLRKVDRRVKALHLSRNFGSHAACLAGLVNAKGDLAVILAADLQDPPELIPEMLAKIEEGFDAVFAARSQRQDAWFTVRLARTYNWLMRRFAIAGWPDQGFDLVVLRRPVRDLLIRWQQKNTSIFAQILWAGFRQASISYRRQPRNAGQSKWSLGKKVKLFVDSFVSFTFTPIRVISYSGMVVSATGSAYALFIIVRRLFYAIPIPGWSSIMVALLLLSGFQLLMLAIIGEYLWRVADEIRGAPPFVVQSSLGVGSSHGADTHSETAVVCDSLGESSEPPVTKSAAE